ncbi:MAG: autotransporter domain-containing protein [Hyphomicrobiales bacterium]
MTRARYALFSSIGLAIVLAGAPAAFAQVQVGSVFNSEGPGPAIGERRLVGSADNPPNGTATGAIEAIAVDPSNPNDILVGAVDGGIWKTTNGGTTWTPLIDQMASISISSLAFDPTDASHKTLVAGTGDVSNGGFVSISRFSTPANFGGLQNGLLYSTDGGATWSRLGAATLSGQSVVDVAARGATILAATFEPRTVEAGASLFSGALYRSTNSGGTFTAISGAGGSGLPAGPVTSLVGDPANANKFYAAVTASNAGTKAQTAVYASLDAGATWASVFTAADSGGLINAGTQTSIKLASGPGGTLAVGLVDIPTKKLTGLFYSNDAGTTWKPLTAPDVTPGAQAPVDIALAIDPNRPNLIYVEGDNNFDNNGGINALAITRVDATFNTSTPISDDNGAAVNTNNGSTVHPDGRVLTIDSNGRLLTGTDGGIYARTNPQNATGGWQGLNGNMVTIEVYSAGFDSNSKRLVVSAQDNGSAYQSAAGNQTYNQRGGGDGVNVAINDKTLGNESAIYTSFQSLGGLQRFIVDQTGKIVSPESGPFFATGVPVSFNIAVAGAHFSSPFILNNIDPTRIALAGSSVYVTQDTLSGADEPGATAVTLTLTNLGAAGKTINNLDYGTRNNPDALIAGGGNFDVALGSVFLSKTATAGSLNPLPAYTGLAPTSVKFDRRSDQRFFVADSQDLYGTVNQGGSFQTLTAKLPANFIRPTALGFVDSNGVDALLVGGLNNVDNAGNPLVVADSDATGNLSGWRRFGSGLPNTTIDGLSYNALSDTLTIATVGRGAWLLFDVTSNFPQATVLQFGLADNDSMPDTSVLTDGTVGQRPLIKYGTGTLTIAGNASYTGGTTINAGTLQLGTGGMAGSILGDVVDNGAFVIDRSDAYTFNGVISGTGSFSQIGTGTTVLTAASTYTGPTNVNAGVLDVNGSLASTVTVNNGGTLMGNGTIGGLNVGNGGTVAPGNSIGTLSVAGNVAFAAGSTFQIEINPAGQGDKIIATGKATLSGGTVQVIAANGVYTPALRYTILTANGGVTGTFAQATINQNLAFLSPMLSYDANDVFLGFAQTAAFPSVAVTRNQAATAAAVQALGFGNPLYNAVLGQTVAGALQAFDALSGEIHASAVTAAMEDSRLPREAILDRLNQPADVPQLGAATTMTGAYAADLPSGKGPALAPVEVRMYQPRMFGAWGQGFGNWGHTASDGNAASLSRSTGGFVLGADAAQTMWNGIFRLGLAGGYTTDSLNVRARLSSGTFESVFGGLYGGASFGTIELRAGALYGTNSSSTTRNIVFPNFADAAGSSYGGSTAQAFAEAGYRIGFSGFNVMGMGFSRASLEPFVGAAAIHIHQNGFVEGGGMAALIGFGRSYDLATTTLGVRAETTLAGPLPITARALVGWRHGFGDVVPTALMAFKGGAQAFGIAGVPIDRDAFVVEAGLDYAVSSMVTAGVSYSGQYGKRATDSAFKGHLDVDFVTR